MNLFAPDRQNTFVVIVTYNPDLLLCESAAVLRNIFSNIIIVDNKSSFDVKSMIKDIDIHYIINDENLGIAQALNIGAEYAVSKGAFWLLMLDQDTIPRHDILSIFNSVYSAFPDKERIGQIGVSFYPAKSLNRVYYSVHTLITSGSLLSLEVYKKIGGFRDDFFIDSVDFEYSLRIKKNGFCNLLSPEVAINHRLGDQKEKRFFFIKIKSTNHSPQRRYYMARNHAIISSQYFFHFPLWVIKKNIFFLISIIQLLLIDGQKKEKIKNIFSGLKDAIMAKKAIKNLQR